MPKKHRIMAMVLVVLFASSLLFSAAFVAECTCHHCCSGSACTVCAVLSLCERVLRCLFLLAAAAICALMTGRAVSGGGRAADGECVLATPVSLRVKLTD